VRRGILHLGPFTLRKSTSGSLLSYPFCNLAQRPNHRIGPHLLFPSWSRHLAPESPPPGRQQNEGLARPGRQQNEGLLRRGLRCSRRLPQDPVRASFQAPSSNGRVPEREPRSRRRLGGSRTRASRAVVSVTGSQPPSPSSSSTSVVLGPELQREGAGEGGRHCIKLQAACLPRDLSRGGRGMETARMQGPEGRGLHEGMASGGRP
jgi:hypothetical protein